MCLCLVVIVVLICFWLLLQLTLFGSLLVWNWFNVLVCFLLPCIGLVFILIVDCFI